MCSGIVASQIWDCMLISMLERRGGCGLEAQVFVSG
jgi:hypothetical protein